MYTVMLRGVGAGLVSSSCISGPEPSARKLPSKYRPRLHQDPMSAARASSPAPRVEPGIQQDAPRGSRSRSLHLLLDSILTPTYLALVSSERRSPRDRGTPTRAQHPYPWGARGSSPRRLHHRPGRRRLGRLAPARPSLAPGRPGSTGPWTGTGPEGPAK